MRNRWNHTTPERIQSRPSDNTASRCFEQVAAFHRDARTLIHPEVAMEIAAWWQGPMNPGFTSFASTGTITGDLLREIEQESRGVVNMDRRDLDALAAYVRHVRAVEREEYCIYADGNPATHNAHNPATERVRRPLIAGVCDGCAQQRREVGDIVKVVY